MSVNRVDHRITCAFCAGDQTVFYNDERQREGVFYELSRFPSVRLHGFCARRATETIKRHFPFMAEGIEEHPFILAITPMPAYSGIDQSFSIDSEESA